MAKPTLPAGARAELDDIAARVLRIPTLDIRRSDSLDFYDVAVWTVLEALTEAYLAGMVAHHKGQPDEMTPLSETEASLMHYLAGYVGSRPQALDFLRAYADWPARAQAELDRRAAQLLEALPETELRLIAAGELDLAALAVLAAKR